MAKIGLAGVLNIYVASEGRIVSQFVDSIRQIKKNWEPYKKWETEQNDKDFQRERLYKKVPASKEELEYAKQYGRTIVDAINTMDQYSVDKAEDIELASQNVLGFVNLGAIVGGSALGVMASKMDYFKKLFAKNPNSKILPFAVAWGPMLLLPMIIMPFAMIKSKTYEKEASRIARFQSREDELKDPKKFVIYTDEQLAEAKNIAKTLPEIPDKKKKGLNPLTGYSDSIKTIKQLRNDYERYSQWKTEHIAAENERKSNLDKLTATPEEIKTAKKDQDNLTRAVRKVELYSQNYLTNVELAINSTLGLDIVAGGIVGGITSGILALLQKIKAVKPDSKFVNKIKHTAPIIAPFVLLIATSFYSIKAKKEAAKIGRFKAKQELLNDPHNFINYDDEQMQSVKDLKAPKEKEKGFVSKTKDDIKSILQFIKDIKAYEKYQKTEAKEEQKLDKALMQVKVSDKQMQDAKSLQKNTFRTFEKMDEMTQRYSDDAEAATNIGKQTFSSLASLGILGSMGLFFTDKIKGIKNKYLATTLAATPTVLLILAQLGMESKAVHIEKQAGRIGVMEAMEDLKDPRLFVDTENTKFL